MVPATGAYRLHYYNGYGTRLKDFDDGTAPCLTEAVARGEALVAEQHNPEDRYSMHSFTLDRRVHNSLDTGTRW